MVDGESHLSSERVCSIDYDSSKLREGKMKKNIECPWCNKPISPKVNITKGEYGDIKEWKCPECEKILSAYLNEKSPILEKVRNFNF